MEFEVSMNITFDILYYIFQILDTEDVPVKQIMSCLPILSQKRWKWYCHHHHHHHHHQKKKKHNFLRKTKNYPKKPPSDLQKLNPDFSEEGKEERQLGMWVFYAKF